MSLNLSAAAGRQPLLPPLHLPSLFVLLLSLFLPLSVQAQPLTESEAVRRALGRPAVLGLAEGAVAAARGEAQQAGLWPNPVLSWERDQVFGAVDEAEDTVALSQELDLGGRRALRNRAGDRRVEAARLEAEAGRVAVAAEARGRFLEAVHAQARVAAVREWQARVAEAATRVEARVRAGDVPEYDLRRMQRERATADARVRQAEAAASAARARLAGLLGGPAGELDGTLAPAAPPDLDAALAHLDERADLRALASTGAAEALEGRAAARGAIPDLSLGAGLRTVEAGPDRGWGFSASVSLPLPVSDRGQGNARAAAGRARVAESRAAIARADAEAEVRALWAEATQLGEAARVYRADAVAPSGRLAAMAETAYRAGQAGVLELLDAWRSVLEASLEAQDLERDARRAAIALDRAAGRGLQTPP
jgi:cobalt-zinc-cadmium efflux system outer membrane protein